MLWPLFVRPSKHKPRNALRTKKRSRPLCLVIQSHCIQKRIGCICAMDSPKHIAEGRPFVLFFIVQKIWRPPAIRCFGSFGADWYLVVQVQREQIHSGLGNTVAITNFFSAAIHGSSTPRADTIISSCSESAGTAHLVSEKRLQI